MIIKAKHNILIYTFFKKYAVWLIKRHFKTIKVIGEYKDKHLPILLISNHISWWDGFWAMYLNVKYFNKKFYFIMLKEQLCKYWFFRYTGGYSIDKKTKSVLETLRYTNEILDNNNNMVLIFPHGEIQSMHNQIVSFEKGIERILKNKIGEIQIIFLTNLVDYLSNPKPSCYMYITEYLDDKLDVKSIESKYSKFYNQSVEKQLKVKL